MLGLLEEEGSLLEQLGCLLEEWALIGLADADLSSGECGFIVLLEHCRRILEETVWIFDDWEGILVHCTHILEQ